VSALRHFQRFADRKFIPIFRRAPTHKLTQSHRYKPDISLDSVVEWLAFQGEDEDPDAGSRNCIQFICDHGGEHLIERKDDGRVRLATGKAGIIFETAKKAAFRTVDIKGQK